MQQVLPIRSGARPWQPNETVAIRQVLDRRGYPRVGVLQHDGKFVVFRQLESPGTERVWAYVTVAAPEVWALEDALGPVGFGQVLERLFRGRRVTMALSSVDLEIVATEDSRGRGSLDGKARSFQQSDGPKARRRTTRDRARATHEGDMHTV